MKIRRFDIYQTAIPFRIRFRHAKASRRHSASVFVRCELEDGSVGYGEGLPREYVTGETWQGVFDDLSDRVLPSLIDCDFDAFGDVEAFCEGLYDYVLESMPGLPSHIGATCCAAELSLLDAYGRHFGCTVFNGACQEEPRYSGVISGSGPLSVLAMSSLYRALGMPAVKLKVGNRHDAANARACRLAMGQRASLRVDANGGWSAENALAAIPRLQRFGVQYVEQPIPPRRYADSRRIQDETGVRIVADEDLRDVHDAKALIEQKACRVFNVRVSKCGGFHAALRIGRMAREHGLEVQVGSQVGESALLSAVGLVVARRLAPVVFMEGCFGEMLLKEDLRPAGNNGNGGAFRFGHGGIPPRYAPESGIDIPIDEDALHRHAVAHGVVSRS